MIVIYVIGVWESGHPLFIAAAKKIAAPLS